MNAAEALAGLELRVPVERLAPLPAGTFYRHDLVGCRVETRDGRADRRRHRRRGDARRKPARRRGAARRGAHSARRGDLHDDRSGGQTDRHRPAGGIAGVNVADDPVAMRGPSARRQLSRRLKPLADDAIRHRHDFSGDGRAGAGGRRRRARDRAGHARRHGPRPARLHDRSASRRGRCAVRRRPGDGAEAGADVPGARRDRSATARRPRR